MVTIPFSQRVSALLRTNTALCLLCIISVGVLYVAFRPSQASAPADAGQKVFVVESEAAAADGAQAITSKPVQRASANLKDMPAPSAYASFTYAEGMTLPVSGICGDTYHVIMIFPIGADYRIDPLLAKYNTAEACKKGKPYSSTLDLAPLHLVTGEKYYVIQADEGTGDSWTNPR